MAGQRQDNAVATRETPISAYERALIFGDIGGLDERGRLEYLHAMCAASGLNPATRPFGYMEQWTPGGNKLVFYLTATGAAQLRTNHGVSITRIVDDGEVAGPKGPCYRWTVYGRTTDGREDVEISSVPLYKAKPPNDLLVGLDYENARKKCLTQGKTRLAKSLTGLAGVLSEDEIDGAPQLAQAATASTKPVITQSNAATVNEPPQRQIAQQAIRAPQILTPDAVSHVDHTIPTPMQHPSTGVVVGTVQPSDDPPLPAANKRFYTDPQTGEMVPAPTPVAQRLYAALRQQAEAESMNTIDPANLLTAEDMNGATNNLVAELAARTVDDAGNPTAEELKDLTDLFRAYDGAGVKLLTPEKRTAGVVRWLIATLTAVRNDVKKRAKAPEAAQAVA